MQDLWIPTGSSHTGVLPVGRNGETGGNVVSHQLMVKATDRFGKVHKQKVCVLADEDTSQAQIEEMMGNAAERFACEVREKYDKRPATEEEKKKIEARRKRKATTDKIRSQVEKAVAAFNEIANVGGRKRTFKPQGKAGKQARARFKEGFTVEDLLLVAQWATDIASSGISPQEASRFGRYSWGFAQPDAKARVTPYVLWNDKFEERLDEARQWKEEPAPASNSYEEGWV